MNYYRLTLTDENRKVFGRRTLIIETASDADARLAQGKTIAGILVDKDGSTVWEVTADAQSKTMVAVAPADLRRIERLEVCRHYGTLVPFGTAR